MSFRIRVTLSPDTPNGFTPGSFSELLHTQVDMPGLDRAWTHTVVEVSVAVDCDSADLTLMSEPMSPLSLDNTLRVDTGTPPARVRIVDAAGNVLTSATLSAPLQEGQPVAIGDDHHVVTAIDWPGRHPETGACTGDLDWQHVTVAPQPRPPVVPTAALP